MAPKHSFLSSNLKPTNSPAAAISPLEEDTRRRVSNKLKKKRRTGHQSPTMELPERLKESTDGAEDEEDVRVPPQGAGMFMNMNQSIFGLIAAAGSRVDFNDRFEGQSSDEEDDGDSGEVSDADKDKTTQKGVASTQLLKKSGSGSGGDSFKSKKQRRKLSEGRLLRSLPSLATKFSSRGKKQSKSKAPQIREEEEPESPALQVDESPSIEITRAEGRLPPVMSRMLEAKAQMAARPSFDLDRASGERSAGLDLADAGPTALAKKLVEIFHFDQPEEVIEEYPCWLLQSVLLQGYMYITARHICFYAYLPKKAVCSSPTSVSLCQL